MVEGMSELTIHCDVAVVGGGPAGLGAARQLRRLGVGHVMVLEREAMAGGIPRHCGHPPFGWQEFHRILTGPKYASRLVKSAESEGVDIRVKFTVTGLEQGPALRVSTPDGMLLVKANRIVLTTGVRETPRAARMVSGNRPMGVLTTGALQSMVYLKSRRPFERPVIVGTELVSFSALLTCRHAGIRPVAMVEKRSRPTAWRAAAWLPAIQGVRTLMNTEVTCIEGKDRVSGVILRNDTGREEHISCDGVVFTGKFVSESTLARLGSLEINPVSGIPVVDQFGRCSDPNIFAAGNMLHPADSSGRCWREGVETANSIARSLETGLPAPGRSTEVQFTSPVIRYVTPQRLVPDHRQAGDVPLWVRFSAEARGKLHLWADDSHVLGMRVTAAPEKQVFLPVPQRILSSHPETITLTFHGSG